MQVLLANEAYNLPPSLLKHALGGKLLTKELAEQPEELTPAQFKAHLPKLLTDDELEFYMVLGQTAMSNFKATGFEKFLDKRCQELRMPTWATGKLPAALPKLSPFGLGQLVEHQSFYQRQLMSSTSLQHQELL